MSSSSRETVIETVTTLYKGKGTTKPLWKQARDSFTKQVAFELSFEASSASSQDGGGEGKYTAGRAGSMHKPMKVSLTQPVDQYDQCGWSKSRDRRQ